MLRYSFVVPIYRDAALASAFCSEYERVFQARLRKTDIDGDVELIFVNDDGSEETARLLGSLRDRFAFVKVINLSRNFGQHIALSCGYRNASGSYVGMLNVDMEDPPDEIPALLDEIERGGSDIVLGVRARRQGPLLDRISSIAFNWLLNQATGFAVPLNVATLRVMNRRFLDAYNRLQEKSRYLPGLEMWLGFHRSYLPIAHRARTTGRSSYTLGRRLRLAFEAIISFSDLPLRFLALVGGAISLCGFALILLLVVSKLFFVDYRPGYTSTIASIVFFGGMQILVTGVGSLYIGRILNEVQGRPLYLIRDAVGLTDPT